MKTKPNPFLSSVSGQSFAAVSVLATLLMVFSSERSQAQTTGFNQGGAGPFDYNTSGNWVGGVINGTWDPSLTTTVAQVVTFASDTALTTGLNFGYTGNFDLALRSSGVANQTITLGGDITVATVSNRTVTIGSTTANQGVNVNLGGVNRTFTVNGAKTLTFLNTLSNGDFTVTGNSVIAAGGTLKLAGANGAAASSNIDVVLNSTLQFDSSASGITGTTRAQSVTLKSGGKLLVNGNSTANSNDTISGSLTFDGSAYRPTSAANSISNVTVTPNASKNTRLTLGGLSRTNGAVALFRGVNLGANPIASVIAGSGNIEITGITPTLVGGGGTTATNVSIIPWALGGTTAADGGSTFVTYSSANGIRTLDTATEFATTFGTATDNVRITSATAVNSATTANSLILSGAALSGTNTLTVTSGAVFLAAGSSTISAGLDFGTAEGVIGYARGNVISGTIAGSGGLTAYGTRTDESLQLTNAASTYTGDTTILGNISVVGGALPSGSRSGNVTVYGNLQLSVAGFTGSINGLSGNGTVSYGNSGVSSISMGDNNATSTFTGTIAGNSNLNVSKIGSGTLTLTGANTNARVVSILGGTLEVSQLADGGVASGIGSSASTATNLILNGGTLKYSGAATTTDRLFQIGVSDGSLNASGSGTVTFTNTGSVAMAQAANRIGTRTSGSNIVTGIVSFTDLTLGARVTGTGIPAGTTITSINSIAGEITLSANATANSSSSLVFITDREFTLAGTNTGDNTLTAILADGAGSAKLSLVKTGTGKWVLSGSNTYTGTTTVSGGTLSLGSASLSDGSAINVSSSSVLNLTHGLTDTVDSFFINGVLQVAGEWGAVGSGAAHQTSTITGTGRLNATNGASSSDPFTTWIDSFTSLTNPADKTRSADPDKDGQSNYVEFALDGNPASGAASGKVRSQIETVGADQALVITLPVRAGAVFDNLPGPAADATIDNLIYTIAGTNDLVSFDQGVTEIAVSAGGMPTLSNVTNWSYRTFRLNGAIGGGTPRGPKGFLRAGITSTP